MQVLHERVPGGEDPQPGHGLDAAHRPKPPFELRMVGFDAVVGCVALFNREAYRTDR
jgi:hypothetical protein